MPTYEYQCDKCKKTFDLYQSMKDEPVKTCPKEQCQMKSWGKGKVKRQLGTGAGLIFKGSGFYTTDYRSEGYKSAANKDTSSESKSKRESAKPEKSEKPASKPAAPEKPKGTSKKD